MHTTNSDGKATVLEMARRCAELGYEHVLVTDHSKSLRIARGMDEGRLAMEAEEVAGANRALAGEGVPVRVLHGIEMDLDGEGRGDMETGSLRSLDVVLGAFHTNLRSDEDQTARYVAALHNPTVHVLAHPRTRKHDRRAGIRADWERVVEAAAATGRALEIDAHPDRQDLDVATLELAREAGCRISIGTDAHSVAELRFMELGLAAAIRAAVPRERILNFMPAGELLAWAGSIGG
ncbi:MAG: hypothetical protein HY658_06920 [Actinobacteria bacterium]|nr:hypothetical protein [Actinomycetota bacterium]